MPIAAPNEQLRARIDQGAVALGVASMYPASGIIEGMCGGWDYAWIDAQHGQHTYESVLHCCQAAAAMGLAVMIRVHSHDPGSVCKYADMAPAALMFPMVNTPAIAAHIVQTVHFPPLGMRSYGGRRVIDVQGRNYYREPQPLVVAQIETVEAVEAVAAIAATDGVDGIFFGPDDMKVQMGIAVETPVTADDRLQDAMRKTVAAAREAGVFCGCTAANDEAAASAAAMGYQMIVGGGDIAFLRTQAQARLEALRGAVAAHDAAASSGGGQETGAY